MDVRALHSKCSELKARIRGLTAERVTLAPRAVNGHDDGPGARRRITAIDKERTKAVSELETCEAALRDPSVQNAALVTRLNEAFERRRRQHERSLMVMLSEAYAGLAIGDNLKNRVRAEGPDKVNAYLRDLPRILAADLTRETVTQDELARLKLFDGHIRGMGDSMYDNSSRISRLEMELEVFKAHTEALLSGLTPADPDVPGLEELVPLPDALVEKSLKIEGLSLPFGEPDDTKRARRASPEQVPPDKSLPNAEQNATYLRQAFVEGKA